MGRPATVPTCIAVRSLLGGGAGGAHPLGGQGRGRAHPRLPQGYGEDDCREGVWGGARGVGERVGGGSAVGVGAAGGVGAALAPAGAVHPPAAATPPAGGAWTLVARFARRRERGPEEGRAAAAGGPAGAAGVPPAVPPAGFRPLPLIAAAPAHHARPSPVERAARAAASLTRERPLAGALVALETEHVSGVTRAAPAQRLRALLADLTGAQFHAIGDVRLFGSITAVILASISVASFSAAVATGSTACVLTLLRGADP